MSTGADDANTSEIRGDYWDDYYAASEGQRRPLPSQFAAFVAGELNGRHRVVEFGCGGGRDAIFFASYGHEVVGVDMSKRAVHAAQGLGDSLGLSATFLASRIDEPGLVERIGPTDGPQLVYARFFLHAITEEEEQSFLDVATALAAPGDLLAVEYRTVRDRSGSKMTGSHYRRFLTPATFQARTLARGFEVSYSVEGFGFAKYQQDDAYVARAIFVRT